MHQKLKANFKGYTLLLVLGILFYRYLLDIAYELIISNVFDYQYFYNNKTNFSYITSWLILVLLLPIILKILNKSSLSSNIISLLIFISLIPTTTMIGFNSNYSFEYIVMIFFYWAFLLVSQIYIPKIRLRIIPNIQSFYWSDYLLIVLSLTVIYISYYYTGFRFHFGLMDVYDIRTEARDYNISFFLGYLSTFSDNILPLLLVYYMARRNWIVSIFISFVILLNFGITGTKQIIFLLFLAILGFLFVKPFRTSKYFIWFFLLIPIISISEFSYLSSYYVSIFSLYRVMFIPSKLHYIYYSYFSVNEFDYFRQSALKWLLDSPYKENIGFIIGYQDIGEWTARANNGLFSDSYMNLGYLGVLVFPILLIIVVKLIEGATLGLDRRLFFIIITSVSFILLGMTLTSALLSSGILLMIIFLNLLPRKLL